MAFTSTVSPDDRRLDLAEHVIIVRGFACRDIVVFADENTEFAGGIAAWPHP
jgi:hypothetical protein